MRKFLTGLLLQYGQSDDIEDVGYTVYDSRDEDDWTNWEKEEIDVPNDEYDERDLEMPVHRIRRHVPNQGVSIEGLLRLCLLPRLAVTLKDDPVTLHPLFDENRHERRGETEVKTSDPIDNCPQQVGTRWGEDWVGIWSGKNGDRKRDEGIFLRYKVTCCYLCSLSLQIHNIAPDQPGGAEGKTASLYRRRRKRSCPYQYSRKPSTYRKDKRIHLLFLLFQASDQSFGTAFGSLNRAPTFVGAAIVGCFGRCSSRCLLRVERHDLVAKRVYQPKRRR